MTDMHVHRVRRSGVHARVEHGSLGGEAVGIQRIRIAVAPRTTADNGQPYPQTNVPLTSTAVVVSANASAICRSVLPDAPALTVTEPAINVYLSAVAAPDVSVADPVRPATGVYCADPVKGFTVTCNAVSTVLTLPLTLSTYEPLDAQQASASGEMVPSQPR
jgi:hypothetical protein